MPDVYKLAKQIAEAVDTEEIAAAESLLRENELIVMQQVDESGASTEDEDGGFNVVLAQMDDEVAVLTFTDSDCLEQFGESFSERIPADSNWPRAVVAGDELLNALPEECGLLLNPGGEFECYFPAGSFGSP